MDRILPAILCQYRTLHDQLVLDPSCYLSCPFNDPENSTGNGDYVIRQPCYYEVTITEVIKGNYMVILVVNFC